MSTEMIEQQLADLKKRVESLEASGERKPDAWKGAFGAMKDCELFDEATKLGAEWREKANREGK